MASDKRPCPNCGSYALSEPDSEGLVDCHDCGKWHSPAAEALWAARAGLAGGWSIQEGALVDPKGRVFGPQELVTAQEIEQALRIPAPVTLFFNHAGSVEAEAVVREARQRAERMA